MDAKLINPFLAAVDSVLPQLGLAQPKRTGMGMKQKEVAGLGVSILVGFAKQLKGNVVYNMPEATAQKIASTMMMGMAVTAIDAMAQSALSEMCTMLSSSAVTNLSGMGLSVGISPPSVTVGAGEKITISAGPYLSVTLDVGGSPLEVNIAVDPA